jgi:alpha-ketoglutarate-dependent 2,4-dichlorophenoxyacetate dioxygenase
MSIEIKQIHPFIGGEVSGVDLRQPLTSEEATAIEAGMDQHAVLIFRGQDITDDQQVAFTKNFGEIEPAIGGNVTKPEDRRLSTDLADVSNLDKNHKVFGHDDRRRTFNIGNRLWHSDSSYRVIPAKFSLLSGRKIEASGGNTEFADMRAAYDALDAKTKDQIEDLVCEHSLIYSRGALGFDEFSKDEQKTFAPVYQCLVRTHPVTGRKSLYLSAHIGKIVGWLTPEARILIQDLTEHATQRQFVHAHAWREKDLVIWDNRQTMHRVRVYDETSVRDMRRTTLKGEATVPAQLVA